MSETVPTFDTLPFVIRYLQEFPSTVQIAINPEGETVNAETNSNFLNSRQRLITSLFEYHSASPKSDKPPTHETFTQAILTEHIVRLAFEPLLEKTGFNSTLAPQTLERSDEQQKGVDLLITDENNLSYLGIDVKLRTSKSRFQRDGFDWNSMLLSPYIYFSLGNWSVDMKEQEDVTIKKWLTEYAIPKIIKTGKIPQINSLRQYMVGRVKRSLEGYQEMLDEVDIRQVYGVPETEAGREVLALKLEIMHSLFEELEQSLQIP